MKKPIVGCEFEDVFARDQRLELLLDIKNGWSDQEKRPLTRRERFERRYLKLHAAGGREGAAEKWFAKNDERIPPPPIKSVLFLLDRYAYRNACFLMLESCELCLLPREKRTEEWSKDHWCDYRYEYEAEHFAESLGEGRILVRELNYSDDWRSYSVYRMTDTIHWGEQRHPGEDLIACLHLCRHEEYTAIERGEGSS